MAAESPLILALLSLIAVCLALITVTVMQTARDVRRTMRRAYEILPSVERAAREMSSTFAKSRRLLAHAHTISVLMEGLTARAGTLMGAAARAWTQMKRRTQQWMEHSLGTQNGTRGEPRRHLRSS